jgi:hypothetical protein
MTTESQTTAEAQEHVHEITIIVNAQPKTVTTKELTFDEVVRLAYPNPPTGPTVEISVTYYRGDDKKPEGTLEEGQSVKVKQDMVFNVRVTDKS